MILVSSPRARGRYLQHNAYSQNQIQDFTDTCIIFPIVNLENQTWYNLYHNIIFRITIKKPEIFKYHWPVSEGSHG